MEPLRARFTVHTYEADAFGQLAVPALTDFLAEAAGHHATALGVGLDVLMARGLTWVLTRQRIEILRAPRLHEELEVETWPSGLDRLAALRDFRVRGADGAELARAISQWYVLDLETRRPRPPLEVLDVARFDVETPHAISFTDGKRHLAGGLDEARPPRPPLARDPDPRRSRAPHWGPAGGPGQPHPAAPTLAALERWDREKRFHVRFSDIDQNLHVNNGSYLSWAIEAMPPERWQSSRVADLEVQYRAECTLGSAILSRVLASGDGAYAHGIVREGDGKELARLTTRWVPR